MTSLRPLGRFALAALAILPFAAGAQPALRFKGLSFQGARLGMTREAWRALPAPGINSARVDVDCAQDGGTRPGNGRTAGRSLAPMSCVTDASFSKSKPDRFDDLGDWAVQAQRCPTGRSPVAADRDAPGVDHGVPESRHFLRQMTCRARQSLQGETLGSYVGINIVVWSKPPWQLQVEGGAILLGMRGPETPAMRLDNGTA